MARKDDYTGVVMHCCVCQEPIPRERKKDAVTCSPQCSKLRKDYFRSLIDKHFCRYCMKPSSAEDRARYQMWRKWEKAGLSESESAAALLRVVEQLKRKLAKHEDKNGHPELHD